MLKRLYVVLAAILLIASVAFIAWQGSFSAGSYLPFDPERTYFYFGVTLLIFLLMLALGFMLVRLAIKLWMERLGDHVGSRIRHRLVVGAIVLSAMPVFFMVLFNYYVLNRTFDKWFTAPNMHVMKDFQEFNVALDKQITARAVLEAQLLATTPETRQFILSGGNHSAWLEKYSHDHHVDAIRILPGVSMEPVARYGKLPTAAQSGAKLGSAPVLVDGKAIGSVLVAVPMPLDIKAVQSELSAHVRDFDRLSSEKKQYRTGALQVLAVIALFILFIATWLAQYMARQISGPIAALLRAAGEVSKGNLSYRIDATAIDEMAQLVGGFNRMTSDLEANRAELEARRRFTEAILESIPTGVISVDPAGTIQRVNKALGVILPEVNVAAATRLEQLFPREDAAEIRYLMNRARRTGLASRQFEVKTPARMLHLAITVSAVERGRNSGFVVVIEDTGDLLRAQKSAAWSEVARRVAHEIKNPLTPIALSAERIVRQLDRTRPGLPSGVESILRECAGTILDETASVKRLVDEFAQFSRLPAARPVVSDINDLVTTGLSVFEGRLDGIDVRTDLNPHLPPVSVDPEQFKRVVVNLVDNAAEAMQDAPLRILNITTQLSAGDTIEIVFADSGCGITPDEKEKLFLPYFSTKGRGTGLGLAIVSHILAEHGASIRVEDNKPSGARFTVEMTPATSEEPVTGTVFSEITVP